jgi:hypothetical protein
MKVYVLGAGVSYTVGYPLGDDLLGEVDRFIRSCGSCTDRFDYKNDWPTLCAWLEKNENPLIREAYRTRQLEQVFTILDQARVLNTSAMPGLSPQEDEKTTGAWSNYERVNVATESYLKFREILLWALEAYLQFKHHDDVTTSTTAQWNYLRAFGRKLCSGDMVITFNYDSTLERILLQQGRWSPRDGYGFEVVFQRSDSKEAVVEQRKSQITILHLHGAVGWYRRQAVKPGYPLPSGGGWLPEEAHTPAPLDTAVSLDPEFLRDLGIDAVDACLPAPPPDERQILVHPSFFKDFELEEHGRTTPFIKLWKKAAELLRKAEQIFVVGYSLPAADSAALTLLLTNCARKKVTIVNPDGYASYRLGHLLSDTIRPKKSLQDWLNDVPDCQE